MGGEQREQGEQLAAKQQQQQQQQQWVHEQEQPGLEWACPILSSPWPATQGGRRGAGGVLLLPASA